MRQPKQQEKNSEEARPAARRDKPISLHPLTFDEAVADILRVPPKPKDKHLTNERVADKKR